MTRPEDLAGRRVVVWGWGVEGRAAARFLRRHVAVAGLDVVDDRRPGPPPADPDLASVAVHTGDAAAAVLAAAEVIVKSPGVSPYRADVRAAATGRVLTGGTALWFAATGGDRTVGVTGSKGKSTTTTLLGHLLAALGYAASVAGNVGRPLLDLLDEQQSAGDDSWRVLELSSFQAAEVCHSPEVGVLTALFPEHLDWHGTTERYYADKCNLFAHRPSIVTVANASNPDVAARLDALPNAVPYGVPGTVHPDGAVLRDGAHELLPLAASPLLGAHNAVNLAGAVTALRALGVDVRARADQVADALATFRPLAHRLEPVGEVDGRLVVDDGLSTAPQAAVAALGAFSGRPVSIIVGGHDRGLDYGPLADALAARPSPALVLAVPESGRRVAEVVRRSAELAGNAQVRVEVFEDFDDAVARALEVTPAGGVILLSPAAPSFGRFTDYADRSRHFRALVGLR